MFKHLLKYGVMRLVEVGRKIRARLLADASLAEALSILDAAQNALEAKVEVWSDLKGATEVALRAVEEAGKQLGIVLREFALVILAMNENDHGTGPYLGYFPFGYGVVTPLGPAEMLSFASSVLRKLEEEGESRLTDFRPRIEAARETLQTAHQNHEASVLAMTDAFEVLRKQRILWIEELAKCRSRVREAHFYNKSYVRLVFAPAAQRRRPARPEDPEVLETAAPETTTTPVMTTASELMTGSQVSTAPMEPTVLPEAVPDEDLVTPEVPSSETGLSPPDPAG